MYYIGNREGINDFHIYFIDYFNLYEIQISKYKLFRELNLEIEYEKELVVKDFWDYTTQQVIQDEDLGEVEVYDFEKVNINDLNEFGRHYLTYNTAKSVELTDDEKQIVNFLHNIFTFIESLYERFDVIDIENNFKFKTNYQLTDNLKRIFDKKFIYYGKLIEF